MVAAGKVLGRYEVRELLEERAAGAVYRARDDELDRNVALEVLTGDDERILRDAQALARLSHPNVVAIFDVGHADGVAFVARELVAGVSLDVWLVRGERTRDAITAVLVQVARGLAAAHEAGFAHGNFAASHVIVGNDGRARVQDFAGAGGGEAATRDDVQRFCALVERTVGRTLTVASMDAAVGALADDLAPRRRLIAFAGAGVIALATGSVLVMRETRAPASTATSCARAGANLASAWSPARRAAIESTFAASDRPFAHKMQATITRVLDRYGEEWSATRIETCRATKSGELLDLRMQCLDRQLDQLRAVTDLLATADADVIEKSLQVVQALPPVAACADAATLSASTPMPTDPEVRAKIQAARTDLARSNALFAAGKLAAATEIVERVHTTAPALGYAPLTAEAAYALGNAQYENGDYAAAEKTLSDGVALALAARRDDLAVRMWRDLVWTVGYQERRFDEAHALAARAEALHGRLPPDPREQAKLFGAIAAMHLAEEHRDEALRYDQQALDLLTRSFGESSIEVATGMTNVGTDYLYMRDFARARDLFARVLQIREDVLGPDHPSTGRALVNLASATAELGRIDEATALQQRALGVLERALGEDHPIVATTLGNLGKDFAMSGRFDEALAAYDRAMAIVARVHGASAPQLAVLHARRAALYRRQGKTAEGLAEYQAGLAIDRAADPESAATGRDLLDIGDTLVALERFDDAKAEYERSFAILERALGADDIELAGPLEGLAAVAIAQHRPAAAIAPLERALALLGSGDESPSDEVSRTRFDLARALWDSGRDRARARQLAEQARAGLAASQDEQAAKTLADVMAWQAAH